MTDKEAIEYAEQAEFCQFCPGLTFDGGCSYDECKVKKFLKVAVEALEKQVAKKPIESETTTCNCPCCHLSLKFCLYLNGGKGGEIYCHHCGQKIDWSEEE